MTAAAAVVLPMPISPVTRARAPPSTSRAATSAPTSSACRHSSTDIAGSTVLSAVPARTRRRRTPARSSGSGVATPTSTTSTVAPIWRARTFTAAPPAAKLATIWAVTSRGHGVTPRATTPWSAAKTATPAGRGTGGGQAPAMPARRVPSDSTPAEGAAGLRQAVLQRSRLGARRRHRPAGPQRLRPRRRSWRYTVRARKATAWSQAGSKRPRPCARPSSGEALHVETGEAHGRRHGVGLRGGDELVAGVDRAAPAGRRRRRTTAASRPSTRRRTPRCTSCTGPSGVEQPDAAPESAWAAEASAPRSNTPEKATTERRPVAASHRREGREVAAGGVAEDGDPVGVDAELRGMGADVRDGRLDVGDLGRRRRRRAQPVVHGDGDVAPGRRGLRRSSPSSPCRRCATRRRAPGRPRAASGPRRSGGRCRGRHRPPHQRERRRARRRPRRTQPAPTRCAMFRVAPLVPNDPDASFCDVDT